MDISGASGDGDNELGRDIGSASRGRRVGGSSGSCCGRSGRGGCGGIVSGGSGHEEGKRRRRRGEKSMR